MKKYLIAAIAAVLFMTVGAGIAYASIPGPDGVIHGCYKTSTGALITIDSAASCPAGYTALNWVQAGSILTAPYVASNQVTIPNDNQPTAVTASCNTGDWATGGGLRTNDLAIRIYGDWPAVVSGASTGWTAIVQNQGAADPVVTVFALCAVKR